METVFSHIIQKRFSNVNEDVATDSLAFILNRRESCREAMTRLLRDALPDLPESMIFRTQVSEGLIRPDMWGYAGSEPRVFIENKFWAGLTDNQPFEYLKVLSSSPQPTLLLFVCPLAREQTLWHEVKHRISSRGNTVAELPGKPSMPFIAQTDLGPLIGLTSWGRLISALEHDSINDAMALPDLQQLRGLCDAADNDAFIPSSRADLTDQRSPAFILQLGQVVRLAIDQAASEGIVHLEGLRPQASWDRIGRYVHVGGVRPAGAGAWFGIDFDLWKTRGVSPLWLSFSMTDFGRGREVWPLVEAWSRETDRLSILFDDGVSVVIDVPDGAERDGVIRALVEQLREISDLLSALPSQS